MDARSIVALRERVVGEYKQYTLSLSASLHEAIGQLPQGSPERLRVALRGAQRANSGYVRQSIEIVSHEVIRQATAQAAKDTGVQTLETFKSLMGSDLDDMMVSNMRVVAEDVIMQMQRDANTVATQYGQLRYQAGIRYTSGLEADRVRKEALVMAETMPFSFMDRAGRRWLSERFVRTRLNMHLFQTHNDVYLYGLSMMGADVAALSYLKPHHDRQGMQFSISGETDGLPAYAEVREKILNPNSEAVVSQP